MKKIIMKVFSNPLDLDRAMLHDSESWGSLRYIRSSNTVETEYFIIHYRMEHDEDSCFKGCPVDHVWFARGVNIANRDRINRLVRKSSVHVYEIVEQVGEVSTTYRTTDKQTFMEIYNNG